MQALEINGATLSALDRVADMITVSTLGERFEVNGGRPDKPYWQPLVNVMIGCDEDSADDNDCNGSCLVTLTVARPAKYPEDTGYDERGLAQWHMSVATALTTQFRRRAEHEWT